MFQDKVLLVSGGAGFIGSHLVDRLINENPKKIIIVDNFLLGKLNNLENARKQFANIEILRVDSSSYNAMFDVVEKYAIDVFFNLAVLPLPNSLEFPYWNLRNNIETVAVACEILRLGKIEKLIHLSSSEVYGSAISFPMMEDHPLGAITPYAASKVSGDKIVESYQQTFGVSACIIRPFNNFGPRQNRESYAGLIPTIMNRIKAKLPIQIFGDGEQTRDFMYVEDCAQAIVDLSKLNLVSSLPINIASGHESSINQIVHKILQLMNLQNYKIEYLDPRLGDVRRHFGDISSANRLIGLQTKEISDASLLKTIEYFHDD